MFMLLFPDSQPYLPMLFAVDPNASDVFQTKMPKSHDIQAQKCEPCPYFKGCVVRSHTPTLPHPHLHPNTHIHHTHTHTYIGNTHSMHTFTNRELLNQHHVWEGYG